VDNLGGKNILNKLSFMITCFDEVNAIDVALTSLRHFYPEEKVVIFCEGNSKNFEFLEKKYNVKVKQGIDSQSDLLKLNDQNYTIKDQEKVVKAIDVLLERISFTAEYSKSEYILLHCPDTLIRGKIEIPDNSGLLGSCVNRYFIKNINEVLLANGGIEVNYFGAVPAIFNVKDFYKAQQIILNKKDLVEKLAEASCYSFSHDIFTSILFSLIGKREEFNPQIIECGRNTNWMDSGCPIIHQFRTFYPKRTTKYKSQENA
jgi:hypothetical protein